MATSHELYIKSVKTDSAAERAGLRAGDEIIQFNGAQINGSLELFKSLLAEIDGQENVPIQIMRENKLLQFNVSGDQLGITVAEQGNSIQKATPGMASEPGKNHTFAIVSGIILFIIGLVGVISRMDLMLKIVGREQILKDTLFGGSTAEDTLTIIIVISSILMIIGIAICIVSLIKALKK